MKLFFLIIAALFPFLLYSDTPVMPEKGHILLDIKYYDYHTDHFWGQSGRHLPTYNKFQQREGICYLEYGVMPCNAFTAKIAYARFKQTVNRNSQGVRDYEFGWRSHLLTWKGNFVTSHVNVIIPSKAGYRAPLRYGTYGLGINLRSYRYFHLFNHLCYYDAKIGYRLYEKYPSDQFRFEIKYGYFLFPRLKILTDLDLIYGVFNGDMRFDASLVELNPNFRLLKGSIQAEYCLFGCTYAYFGLFQHLWGRNVGSSGGLFTGIYGLY